MTATSTATWAAAFTVAMGRPPEVADVLALRDTRRVLIVDGAES